MQEKTLINWLEYIETLELKEVELGIERIRPVFKKVVKLSSDTKIVVVGGTNGKGSTVEFLSQLLISNKKRVGTFTSPHLFNFNERIRVNGIPVSDKQITDRFKLIEENRGSVQLTYFDFSTLAALSLFSDLNLDVLVLEIGLGGRLDPVNVVDPDLSILTNVELDHQERLGNDRESIGREKAAIFRKKKIVILGQHDLPNAVVEQTHRLGNKVFKIGREFDYKVDDSLKEWMYEFKAEKSTYLTRLQLPSLSVSSLSCALTAFLALGYELDMNVNNVLSKTYLKGRCELIDNRFLVDVSHNASSAEYLSSFIKRNFKSEIQITAVLGVMKGKDINSIIKPFKKKVSKWYLTSPDNKRAMKTEELLTVLGLDTEARVSQVKSVSNACTKAHQETPKGSLIIIFGSFYTAAEAFSAIKPLRSVA